MAGARASSGHPAEFRMGTFSGEVLVIGGGINGSGFASGIFQALNSVEIYDPQTKTFSAFGTMTDARWGTQRQS